MLDLRTSSEHRLLQVFLSARGRGIFEVYLHLRTQELSCTCPGSRRRLGRDKCMHTDFVQQRIAESHGGYGVQVQDYTQATITEEVAQDPVRFRAWVLQHARVEVL